MTAGSPPRPVLICPQLPSLGLRSVPGPEQMLNKHRIETKQNKTKRIDGWMAEGRKGEKEGQTDEQIDAQTG